MTDHRTGAVLIVAACAVILLIGLFRIKSEWLLNVTVRSILGTIGIFFTNLALSAAGIPVGVGINPITVLTTGILGFPGFVGLYGLGFYKLL